MGIGRYEIRPARLVCGEGSMIENALARSSLLGPSAEKISAGSGYARPIHNSDEVLREAFASECVLSFQGTHQDAFLHDIDCVRLAEMRYDTVPVHDKSRADFIRPEQAGRYRIPFLRPFSSCRHRRGSF